MKTEQKKDEKEKGYLSDVWHLCGGNRMVFYVCLFANFFFFHLYDTMANVVFCNKSVLLDN